ncbi:uncharacterized protein [Argopecten irradians]|uniref:uncharacterized protein n=1 Tax=Argopecten irradians TaxID=31199 RepID=UPI00371D1C7F
MADDDENDLERLCTKSVSIFMEKVTKMIPRVKLRDFTMQCIGCVPMMYLGSQAECIHGLNSDTDIMYESQTIKVVQNLEQTRELGILTQDYDAVVVFDSEGVHQGYTKIKLFDIRRDQAYEEVDVPSLCIDGYLSNNLVSIFWKDRLSRRDLFPSHGMKNGLYQHGPCITFKYTGTENRVDTDIDSVFTLPCLWPEQANDWFTRPRQHGWPDGKLQNKLKSLGCHLVPIGHTCSPQRHLEWRISFNKPERQLVWSFNGTQFACVDFMKIFFHVKISPKFPDLFPSYFIKTIMFWMVEESDQNIWKPQNLCSCLQGLLDRIISCVEKKELKNYFIPSNNMMDTKPAGRLDALLVELRKFQTLGQDKWKPVLKARIDEKNENDIYFYHVQINALSTVRHYIINLLSTTENKEFTRCIEHINSSMEYAIEQELSKELWALLQVEIGVIQKLHEHIQFETRSSSDLRADINGILTSAEMERETNDKFVAWMTGQKNVHLGFRCLHLATWYLSQEKYPEARREVDMFVPCYGDNVVHYTFHNRDKKPKDCDFDIKYPRPSLEETLEKFVVFDVVCLPMLHALYPKSIQTMLEKMESVLFMNPLFYGKLIKFHCFKAEKYNKEAAELAQQLAASAKHYQNNKLEDIAALCVE